MLTDLHIHTYFSDGSLSPEEVVADASSKGIGLISVCDHNTTAAYGELVSLCAGKGIRLINGIEIDCMMNSLYLHVLSYGADIENTTLQAILKDNREKMEYYGDAVILNMAADYGIDTEDYTRFEYPREMGGYKNSNYLLLKGYIKRLEDYWTIHEKYGIPIAKTGLPDIKKVCSAIENAGGVAVLAHPYDTLNQFGFEYQLKQAVVAGICGFECYYPSHGGETTGFLTDFCERLGLAITGGSDGHGIFNAVVNGVEYSIGVNKIDSGKIRLTNKLQLE